jgi:two-component system response regulator RstA
MSLHSVKPTMVLLATDQGLSVETAQSLSEQFVSLGFEASVNKDVTATIESIRQATSPVAVFVSDRDAISRLYQEAPLATIIMLAMHVTTDELISALDAGADIYQTLPQDPKALAARAQALVRRVRVLEANLHDREIKEWYFKGLTVHAHRRRITCDNEAVELTTAEFDLLRLLVVNRHQIMSRDAILDQLRGIEWASVDRSIDILVSRLRDKLRDDPKRPRYIRTVRSLGYQFVGEPCDPTQRQ